MTLPENAIKADFKKPILFVAGDTIQVMAVRGSGSLSPRYGFVDIHLNDTTVIGNKLFDGVGNTAINQSATIAADITAEYMKIGGRSQNFTGTDYSCEVQIFKNGERVI